MIVSNIQPPPPVAVRKRRDPLLRTRAAVKPARKGKAEKRSETFRRLAGRFQVKAKGEGFRKPMQDIFWFSSGSWAECAPLPLADAEELLRHDKLDLDDQFNDSPVFRDVLAFARRHRGNGGFVWFTGYRVGPMRDDKRIQIDGMLLSLPITAEEKRLLKAFRPDEWDEYPPDEDPEGPQVPYLRVWWD